MQNRTLTTLNKLDLDNTYYDIVFISNIEFLSDFEILKMLDVLIELTSAKKKFFSDVHSVGGKRTKVVLRKYECLKFVE